MAPGSQGSEESVRIRMKQLYAGPWGSAQPEQVVDRPAAEARKLIRDGYAVAVDEPTRPARKRAAKKSTRKKSQEPDNTEGGDNGSEGGSEGGSDGEGGE